MSSDASGAGAGPETAAEIASAEAIETRSLLARILPKLLISLALGALYAWIVARGGVPIVPPARELRAISAWAVPVYLASLVFVHYFRASRWRFLIAPVKQLPRKDVVLLNWIGFFAIFALPLRLGELALPALTELRHGIPISVRPDTVAVERVVDGLITSACVAWAVLVLPRRASDDV